MKSFKEGMEPRIMREIIDGVRYDTEKAQMIAKGFYLEDYIWEYCARKIYLYKTPNGRYFAMYLTQRPGEIDHLTPLPLDVAMSCYEWLPEHVIPFKEAFPTIGIKIEEA